MTTSSPRPDVDAAVTGVRSRPVSRAAGRRNPKAVQGLDALMIAYADGSQAAFTELYERLRPYIRRQIGAKIRNADIVDDLTQQAFMRLHSARVKYVSHPEHADRRVLAWVGVIARNLAADHLRGQHRDRLCFGDAAERRMEDAAASETSAPDAISLAEEEAARVAALHEALAALGAGQREVVIQHKLRGVPMREVAEEMGARSGAIRVRAHRAYKRLRALLGQPGLERSAA